MGLKNQYSLLQKHGYFTTFSHTYTNKNKTSININGNYLRDTEIQKLKTQNLQYLLRL